MIMTAIVIMIMIIIVINVRSKDVKLLEIEVG